MIKRVVTLEDARILKNSFDLDTIKRINPPRHLDGVEYNPDLLFSAWADIHFLVNECVIVANFDTPKHIDSFIWFVIGVDYRHGKKIAQSYLWISPCKKTGVQLLKEAERILLLRNDVEYITLGVLDGSDSKSFGDVICKRFGYRPEGHSYYINTLSKYI